MLIDNLNLKQKLTGSFAIVFLSFLIIGLVIYKGILDIQEINRLMEGENKALSFVHQTRQNNLSLRFRATRMFTANRIKDARKFQKRYEEDAAEMINDLAAMDSIYSSIADEEPEELDRIIFGSKDSTIVYLDQVMLPNLHQGAVPLDQFISKTDELNNHLKKDSLDSERIHELTAEIKDLRSEALDYAHIVYSNYGEVNRIIKNMRDSLQDSIAMRQARIQRVINQTLIIVLVAIGLALAIILGISSFLNRIIVPPVRKVAQFLTEFAAGQFPDIKLRESQDEIGTMGKEINKLKTNLELSTNFANAMGKGNFEMDFEAKDALGQSLLGMRDSLKVSYEQEQSRKFLSEGLAQINNVLRKQTKSLEEFGDNLLYSIIKYLNLQIGAFYVANEDNDETILEMKACYAYDRKKFIKTTVRSGEGIVGQAFNERAHIFLANVPESYIKIRSGLGDTPPGSVYCTPLIHNDVVVGVLEFASVKPMTDLGKEFIEGAAEVIASDLSAQKINNETKRLLDDSQKRTQQMQSQEEELRQNMEELQATQEAITRSESRTQAILENIQDGIITLDATGVIGSVNKATTRMFGYDQQELEGANASALFGNNYNEILEYAASEIANLPEKTIRAEGRKKNGSRFNAQVRLDDAMVGSERLVIALLKPMD
ncbi:PAS domain S-box protein [Fulvivirga sp. M361]|uniref:GAF domain-containing protein n=1 Tax=Fulvivirga sp. M361 TaxID=2594266 RepID=UPI00117A83EF|nr:GAF domain-containing protein [Fulvivirga sp. M361]TRX54301.1 PAS domain S-box protein [Fulvivirga sp. M361]